MLEVGLKMAQKDRKRHRRSDKFRPVTGSRVGGDSNVGFSLKHFEDV